MFAEKIKNMDIQKLLSEFKNVLRENMNMCMIICVMYIMVKFENPFVIFEYIFFANMIVNDFYKLTNNFTTKKYFSTILCAKMIDVIYIFMNNYLMCVLCNCMRLYLYYSTYVGNHDVIYDKLRYLFDSNKYGIVKIIGYANTWGILFLTRIGDIVTHSVENINMDTIKERFFEMELWSTFNGINNADADDIKKSD